MKRFFTWMMVLLLLCLLPVKAHATEDSRRYCFELAVNGVRELQVSPGEIVTVTLRLRRTDASQPAVMYAMQDEVTYDPGFFQLVEGSGIAAAGMETTVLTLRDGSQAFYMNYVNLDEGEEWQPDILLGTFQLKVIADRGSAPIVSRNCQVSNADGSASVAVEAKNVTVVISQDCKVHFETNGGSQMTDIIAERGARLTRPEDPHREGYTLEGWYTDRALTRRWEFDRDTVQEDMTLYARWEKNDATACCVCWMAIGLVLVLFVLLVKKNAGRRRG